METEEKTYQKTVLVLGLAGLLFAGYLSAYKVITTGCALNEPCPYFLGYPACWYGFGMFLTIFTASLLGALGKIKIRTAAAVNAAVSALGILFAGSFTVPEIGNLLSGTTRYALGLPSCAYGLVFYILIFVLSAARLKRRSA